MAVFDLIAPVLDLNIHAQCDAINNHYFKDETVSEKQAYAWLDKNISIFTAATQGDDAYGFFEILPVTGECAVRLETENLTEEDITPDDIIAYEDQRQAEYAYVSAIAVAETNSRLFDLSCTAALASGMCSVFLNGYDRTRLKKVFIHTVTPEGASFARRFGFEKIRGEGFHAMRVLTLGEATWPVLEKMQRRFGRFILHNSWNLTADD